MEMYLFLHFCTDEQQSLLENDKFGYHNEMRNSEDNAWSRGQIKKDYAFSLILGTLIIVYGLFVLYM